MARKIQVEIVGDAKSLEKAFKRAGNAGDGFQRKMRTAGKLIGVGIGGGILAVGFALKRGFSELAEAQKVAAQTNAVLKSTGGIANVTAKHVEKLATSLSRMSGIDDEDIASIENMLLTFTNIRNGAGKNEKVFDDATKAVLDLSVATGKDFVSSAVMVGKALNDLEVNSKGTITGWSALRRVGVQVTAGMMEQAAAFIRAGQPMRAQQLLLKELNTEFGNSAREYGKTMPGALGKLRNAFDEISAAFASGFLPLILRVSGLLTKKLADPAFVARVRELGTLIGTKLFNAFQMISQWFAENWAGIKNGFRTAQRIAQALADTLRDIASITPGGADSLIGLIISGVLLSKLKKLAVFAGASTLVGAGGKGRGGKGGGGAKKAGAAGLLAGVPTPVKVAAAVLATGGGGTQRGDRSDSYPLTYAAVRAAARGNLGPKALAVLKDALDRYSLANAPDKKMREAENRLRKLYRQNQNRGNGLYGGPRARGGPVMAGMSYLVGERGPEMFVPGQSGSIVPNGGGPTHIHVHVGSHKVAEAIIGDIQRLGHRGASQQRGRLGGQNLALS